VEVVASLSQGRTAAAQCGLFTHKLVPVIFEPPCIITKITCLLLNYNVLSNVDSSKPCGYFMYQEFRHLKKKKKVMPTQCTVFMSSV